MIDRPAPRRASASAAPVATATALCVMLPFAAAVQPGPRASSAGTDAFFSAATVLPRRRHHVIWNALSPADPPAAPVRPHVYVHIIMNTHAAATTVVVVVTTATSHRPRLFMSSVSSRKIEMHFSVEEDDIVSLKPRSYGKKGGHTRAHLFAWRENHLHFLPHFLGSRVLGDVVLHMANSILW